MRKIREDVDFHGDQAIEINFRIDKLQQETADEAAFGQTFLDFR